MDHFKTVQQRRTTVRRREIFALVESFDKSETTDNNECTKRKSFPEIISRTSRRFHVHMRYCDNTYHHWLMHFIEISPVPLPPKLELNNWIEQFVQPFPIIAELTSFNMQCSNASSKLVFEQRTTSWDIVKERLTKIILVFLNVELLIRKRSQLSLYWTTALPPLMPKNETDLFSSMWKLDVLNSLHSLYT